jgi:large subunit ribosomal protein L25
MTNLKAELRDTNAKLGDLRKAGRMPAVFYGKKETSTPISISLVDFLKVWKQSGESSVVTLETSEGSHDSLIHEIDFHPVSGVPRHADFYVFEKGPAVKDLGGTLVKVLHALKIEALPKDLPHNITIDISTLLNFNDQILAQDIKLPAGVTLMVNPEEVVALVSAPREEKEEEVAPIDLSAIEVEKKGKDEAADEASAEAAA